MIDARRALLVLSLLCLASRASAQLPDPAGGAVVEPAVDVEVRIDDVRVLSGHEDPTPFVRVLRSRRAMLRACLVRAEDALPGHGAIEVRALIDAEGRAREPEVSEVASPRAGRAREAAALPEPARACALERFLLRLRFAVVGAPTRIAFVVRFAFAERERARVGSDAALAAARAEVDAARSNARCLVAGARRLERAARRLERAGRSERARTELEEARAALAGCGGLLRALSGVASSTITPHP